MTIRKISAAARHLPPLEAAWALSCALQWRGLLRFARARGDKPRAAELDYALVELESILRSTDVCALRDELTSLEEWLADPSGLN